MTSRPQGDLEPVTVGISRQVKSDRIAAFEVWLDEIKTEVARFEGYAGMDVVRPVDPKTPTYVIILRFDTYEKYTFWHESPERAWAVERSAEMTVGEPALEEVHGLEAWFTPPAVDTRLERPARYKMTILTTVTLYPLIVVVGGSVAALLGLPVALGTLITVIIVAGLATYWVMPWITRVFRWWLFPKA